MNDLRQQQITEIEDKIRYLEEESEKAISERKALVNDSLTRTTEEYSKEDESRTTYEDLTLTKEALDRDGQKWIELEKEKLELRKELFEKMDSNRKKFERWLQNRD